MYPKRKGGSFNRNGYRSRRPNSNRYGNGPRSRSNCKFWSVDELERVINQLSNSKSDQTEEKYTSINTFQTFEIDPKLKTNIVAKGYSSPTPIQDKVIPEVLSGRDVIGIANTGTGKTAAFLIPAIDIVQKDRNRKVLILTPTRELAMQIYQEFREFSQGMGIYTAIIIGGSNIERQKMELRRNPNFVIATPGRLKDLLRQKAIKLDGFNTVVLDETDRMVDIGFIEEIKFFISQLPVQRQSLFFSATLSPKIEDILKAFVTNPVSISVKKRETSANVEQKIVKIPRGLNKTEALHQLLLESEYTKVLVFSATKREVQKISDELSAKGHKTGAIHGDKRQSQRTQVLKMFKANQIKVLTATDVASRGLDISGVSHVINYSMPESYEAYVHRIGRTGRANKKGVALTFVEDRGY